jgi:hypothetical protein
MSEQNSPPVFSLGGLVEPPVAIEFADGVRQVPAAFVAELGGGDELRKLAPALKRVTFEVFMGGFSAERSGRLVSGAVSQIVGQHLRMFRL